MSQIEEENKGKKETILTLVNLELKNLNEDAFINSPHNILHLNVSNNLLSKGVDFLMFSSLRTLIIDNNHFSKLKGFPQLSYLETFSANKNKFSSAKTFIEEFKFICPNCLHLSLILNPMCPIFASQEKYKKYQEKFKQGLPKLKLLDGMSINYEIQIQKNNEKIKKIKEKSQIKKTPERTRIQSDVNIQSNSLPSIGKIEIISNIKKPKKKVQDEDIQLISNELL